MDADEYDRGFLFSTASVQQFFIRCVDTAQGETITQVAMCPIQRETFPLDLQNICGNHGEDAASLFDRCFDKITHVNYLFIENIQFDREFARVFSMHSMALQNLIGIKFNKCSIKLTASEFYTVIYSIRVRKMIIDYCCIPGALISKELFEIPHLSINVRRVAMAEPLLLKAIKGEILLSKNPDYLLTTPFVFENCKTLLTLEDVAKLCDVLFYHFLPRPFKAPVTFNLGVIPVKTWSEIEDIETISQKRRDCCTLSLERKRDTCYIKVGHAKVVHESCQVESHFRWRKIAGLIDRSRPKKTSSYLTSTKKLLITFFPKY